MQTENIFIAHPTSIDQINALKAFVKALKIKFEVAKVEQPYNPEFVAKIQKGKQETKAGKGTVMTMDELNSLWK